jgi:hypothetical protein
MAQGQGNQRHTLRAGCARARKTCDCLGYLLFKPFPSFSYLSYFAKTEGSGEVPPIDLKTRLAGRLALPITGPKVVSHGRGEALAEPPPIDLKKAARREARPTDHRF